MSSCTKFLRLHVYIYPGFLQRVVWDTRSIFKSNTAGWNLVFTVSKTGFYNKAKEPPLHYQYLWEDRWVHAFHKGFNRKENVYSR